MGSAICSAPGSLAWRDRAAGIAVFPQVDFCRAVFNGRSGTRRFCYHVHAMEARVCHPAVIRQELRSG